METSKKFFSLDNNHPIRYIKYTNEHISSIKNQSQIPPFLACRRKERKMNTSQTRQEKVILPFTNMMYPFMTLDDNAEIVHSEMGNDGRVKVYIEKPDAKDGFHRATCYLPSYTWEDIFGFSDEELDRYKKVIESTAHLIIEFSQKGGFSNAANL
jgi:hypothetical protein